MFNVACYDPSELQRCYNAAAAGVGFWGESTKNNYCNTLRGSNLRAQCYQYNYKSTNTKRGFCSNTFGVKTGWRQDFNTNIRLATVYEKLTYSSDTR